MDKYLIKQAILFNLGVSYHIESSEPVCIVN